MKLIALLLCLYSTPALAYDFSMNGYRISSTLIEQVDFEEVQFIRTVTIHFRDAKLCWKQPHVPNEKMINRVIYGCLMAYRRFWTGQPERMYQLFALIISESGGNNIGNPTDPSYGVCHASFASAHTACYIYAIPHPKCKLCTQTCNGLTIYDGRTFKNWLEESVSFNIMCGAGELERALGKTNNDLVRAIGIYKYGAAGYIRAVERLNGKPITALQVWQGYSNVLEWLMCLRTKTLIQDSDNCGCLPIQILK